MAGIVCILGRHGVQLIPWALGPTYTLCIDECRFIINKNALSSVDEIIFTFSDCTFTSFLVSSPQATRCQVKAKSFQVAATILVHSTKAYGSSTIVFHCLKKFCSQAIVTVQSDLAEMSELEIVRR